MSEVLTREALRERIDTMERLESVLSAIEDVSSCEEPQVDLTFCDRSPQKSPVAFAHGMPCHLVLAGLRAMQAELEKQL
jgi:hypothetical protein